MNNTEINPFDSIELNPIEVKQSYNNNKNKNPFDELEVDETWGKWLVRSLYQIPSGIAKGATWGLDVMMLLGAGDALDPLEIQRYQDIAAREGVPFDLDAYYEAVNTATSYFPTVSNAERIIEEKTGLPLEAKTGFQKFVNFASLSGKIAPNPGTFRGLNTALPRPVLGAGVAGTAEGLKAAGVNETIADLASLGILKQPPAGASSLSFGKTKSPSGLIQRQFEDIRKPTEISTGRLGKINEKIEGEFRQITNKIISESPLNETYSSIKNDASFINSVSEQFKEVEKFANEMPGNFSSEDITKSLESRYKNKESKGLTPSEYDKDYAGYMKRFIEETPIKEATAGDLVKQYRTNNQSLKEYFEPGKSRATNRAKRDALLDYNEIIAKTIEQKYPETEFSELFKYTNKKWSEIKASESINEFVNDLFEGKINFKEGKSIFDNKITRSNFKRAMGEESFNQFEQLNKDLLSKEQAYKLLKEAKTKGFGDLANVAISYVVKPQLLYAKYAKDTAKTLFQMALDKPKFSLKWDKGINALKDGKFAQAEGILKEVKEEAHKPNAAKQSAANQFNQRKNVKPEVIPKQKATSPDEVLKKEFDTMNVLRENMNAKTGKDFDRLYQKHYLDTFKKIKEETGKTIGEIYDEKITAKIPINVNAEKIKPQKLNENKQIEAPKKLLEHKKTISDKVEQKPIKEKKLKKEKSKKLPTQDERHLFGDKKLENVSDKKLKNDLKMLKEKRDAIKGKTQNSVKKKLPYNKKINAIELELDYRKKEVQKLQKPLEPKIEKIKHQDISKQGLKKQKVFFLDALQEALENPTTEEMIKINIPDDGVFKVVNDKNNIEKMLKKVKSKWPIMPLKTSH